MGGLVSKSADGGKLLKTVSNHYGAVKCMAVSEDGSVIVTGSEDRTARIWSAGDKAECFGVLDGHTSPVNAVALRDIYVVTASADGTIRKWDMATCACLFIYEGHTSRIHKLIVTDEFIFSSSYDRTAKAWLFATDGLDEGAEYKACIRTFKGHIGGVWPLIFIPAEDSNPDDGATIDPGDVLITGSGDNTARSWSFDKGSCLNIFKGHTGPVMSMSTDANCATLFTGGEDGSVRSWNIATGQVIKIMEGHSKSVICLLMANRLLFTGSVDATAKCWVTESGDCTRIYRGHKSSVVAIAFHEGLLYTGSCDGLIRSFDAQSGQLLVTYSGHAAQVNCLMVLGDRIYSGSADQTLKIWDTKNTGAPEVEPGEERPNLAIMGDPSMTSLNEEEEALEEEGQADLEDNDDENPPLDEAETDKANDEGDIDANPEQETDISAPEQAEDHEIDSLDDLFA